MITFSQQNRMNVIHMFLSPQAATPQKLKIKKNKLEIKLASMWNK